MFQLKKRTEKELLTVYFEEMKTIQYLAANQQELVQLPLNSRTFLEGNAGAGKTTAAIFRLQRLLENQRIPARVLILTPSRTNSAIYQDTVGSNGARATISTFNSIVKRSIDLFWPAIAQKAAFGDPAAPPTFLTIESAQILMAQLIQQKIDDGYFSSLQLPTSRIYNQVLIALHKSASASLPFEDYANRMSQSWTGDSAIPHVFSHVQECGMKFKEICYANNFLDYAIQLEVFQKHLLPSELFRTWLKLQYDTLIYDNVEEDIPAAHDFAEILLDGLQSALFIFDHLGGFRNFMSSDPQSAVRFASHCDTSIHFGQSFVNPPAIQALSIIFDRGGLPPGALPINPMTIRDMQQAFIFQAFHQYPQMIKQAAQDVADLIHRKNVAPKDIVIIAPLLSDVLYTSLERELRIQNVKCYIHRPSRALIHERETRSFLTLIKLLHPEWGAPPKLMDVCDMLLMFIPGLDPIRAQLLVSRSFALDSGEENTPPQYKINPAAKIPASVRNRIPALIQKQFEKIREWLQQNHSNSELPGETMIRFFHEILTQPGFAAMHGADEKMNYAVLKVSESMKKFNIVIDSQQTGLVSWKDYFTLVNEGMVAAYYFEDWFAQPDDAVLITLSSAFALTNRPVSHQIWLNAGSPRWWERVYGQLTNDTVLSRDWQTGEKWDVERLYKANDENMNRLILALFARCRKQIRIYASELNETGQDQKSKLLYALSDLFWKVSRLKAQAPNDDQPDLAFSESLSGSEAAAEENLEKLDGSESSDLAEETRR